MRNADFVRACMRKDPELGLDQIEFLKECAEKGSAEARQTLIDLKSDARKERMMAEIIDIDELESPDMELYSSDEWEGNDDWDLDGDDDMLDAYWANAGPTYYDINEDPEPIMMGGKIPFKKGDSLEAFRRKWEKKRGIKASPAMRAKWARRVSKGRHPQEKGGLASKISKGFAKALNPVKSLKFAAKGLKKISGPILKAAKGAAKVLGPAISAVYPPAAGMVKGATKLLGAAERGISGAQKKIKSIQRLAGQGDPKAKRELDGLKIAKAVQNNQRGQKILRGIGRKDPRAVAYASSVKYHASLGNPKAEKEYDVLMAARAGQKLRQAEKRREKQRRKQAKRQRKQYQRQEAYRLATINQAYDKGRRLGL